MDRKKSIRKVICRRFRGCIQPCRRGCNFGSFYTLKVVWLRLQMWCNEWCCCIITKNNFADDLDGDNQFFLTIEALFFLFFFQVIWSWLIFGTPFRMAVHVLKTFLQTIRMGQTRKFSNWSSRDFAIFKVIWMRLQLCVMIDVVAYMTKTDLQTIRMGITWVLSNLSCIFFSVKPKSIDRVCN